MFSKPLRGIALVAVDAWRLDFRLGQYPLKVGVLFLATGFYSHGLVMPACTWATRFPRTLPIGLTDK
jgi:hypothetical protein